MSDQNKDARTEKNNPGQATPNPAQNKGNEGAFGFQKGKDIHQAPKNDMQTKEPNNPPRTGN